MLNRAKRSLLEAVAYFFVIERIAIPACLADLLKNVWSENQRGTVT